MILGTRLFSVTSSIAGIGSEEANVAAFSRAGKNVEGTIAGQIAMGNGQFLTAIDGTKASGVTVAYEREIGLKEVPVLDQRGVQVGTEFIEETNEEVVGGGPEGYVHVAQFSNEFQLGPNAGQSERLSLKNVKHSCLGKVSKTIAVFRVFQILTLLPSKVRRMLIRLWMLQ